MRGGQRGEVQLGFVFFLALIALLCVAATFEMCEAGDRCRQRGGYFYCAYRSPCVCLAKGMVLP